MRDSKSDFCRQTAIDYHRGTGDKGSFVTRKESNAGSDFIRLSHAAEGVKLVDIRRPEEWRETGIVEGSLLITAFDAGGRLVPDFPGKLAAAVDRDEQVMLICRTGNRTSVIAEALSSQAGYRNVFNVTDGIVAWLAQKRPVVAP